MKRFINADPTANAAIRSAARSSGIPSDLARVLAAQALLRGDLAGADLFLAAARRQGVAA